MKTKNLRLLLSIILFLPVVANATLFRLEAVLSSAQEVCVVPNPCPNGVSNANGTANMWFNSDSNTFDLDLSVFGITLSNFTGAHIHLAASGANGPIIVNLGAPNIIDDPNVVGDPDLRWQLFSMPFPVANEAALLAGNTYINVHSTQYPAGETRGQLIVTAVPEPKTLLLLGLGLCTLAWVYQRRGK